VCTIHENQFKPGLDRQWAYLVYAGLWWEPLRDDLDAYMDRVNEHVTGTIGLKLYKGSARVAFTVLIVLQLLAPFLLGQVARRWLVGWVTRNDHWLKNVDRSSVVLVVFSAWTTLPADSIGSKPEIVACTV